MVPTPYRIASPPEPLRTDEADDYELLLVAERGRERRTGVLIALLGLTLFVIAFSTISPRRATSHADEARARVAQRIAHARVTIDQISTRVTSEQDRFEGDVRAVLGARPTTPVAACAASLPMPTRIGRAAFPLITVKPGDRHFQSATIGRIAYDLERAKELLAGESPADAIVYAEAFDATPLASRLVRDVVFLQTRTQSPVVSSPTTYEPGAVDGIAYVYDWSEHRVTCAAEIHAQSTRALEYSYNDGRDAPAYQDRGRRLDATLEDDLAMQIGRAIATPGALSAFTP